MSSIQSLHFSANIPTHVRKLLGAVDVFCSEKEQWEDALTLSTIVLKELENALGSDSRDVGLILSVIGMTNKILHKYDEAEKIWRRAFLVLDKYDEEADLTIFIGWNLVKWSAKNKRLEEVEFFGKKMIELSEKHSETDALKHAQSKVLIGEVCLYLGKLDEAKKFLREALTPYVKKIGNADFHIDKIFESLEIAHFWKNDMAESEVLFENSNEIADVTPLCLLGMLYEDENLSSKAVSYYQRAVKIYESKDAPDDLQLADISLKLGKCYLKIGNWFGSQLFLNKSRAIYEKTLADDDPVMLDVKIHLALCCVKNAKLDVAKKIYEEILGHVHMNGSGVSILDWVRDNETIEVAEIPVLNGQSNFIVPVLMNLGALYVLDGKYKAAKILQNFGESLRDLIEHDGKQSFTVTI